MHKLVMAIVLCAAAGGVAAHSQGFAFTNNTLAASNCKAASADERSQAVSLANDAMSRFPHAMLHVHVDGLQPHQGARDESEQAMRDWDAARDLAVGYCVTQNTAYLDHADAIIVAWLKAYQPDFNPVDETNLEQLFLAADILGDAMPAPLYKAWQAFAAKLSAGYLAEIDKNAGTANSRQSQRIKLAAMAAYVTADTGAIGHVESAFTTQIGANIKSDGSVSDYDRHDSLRPVVFDLQPLVIAALAAHDHGENWYGITASGGSTMQAALQWLSPYAKGTQTNQEQSRPTADTGSIATTWSPSASASLYLYASALDRQWSDLATQLVGMSKLWQRLEMGMS